MAVLQATPCSARQRHICTTCSSTTCSGDTIRQLPHALSSTSTLLLLFLLLPLSGETLNLPLPLASAVALPLPMASW